MDDKQIIELYWQRDEAAIEESQSKYGSYCSSIAERILHSAEDTEECVNDTWLRAWNSIPPQRPNRLAVFFGTITRNLAIDRYRRKTAQKSGGGQIPLCLAELEDCVGELPPIEDRLALKALLQSFLRGMPDRNREIFLLRYWYCMPVKDIAGRYGMREGAVKTLLHRLRAKLKAELEKEGTEL